MTQQDALLAAVCATPDDHLPRLVYADWCDENGDPARAEFIRTQIAIANGAKGKKLAKLQEREKQLLDEHRAVWTEPLEEFTDNHFDEAFRFHRGFVETISIDGATLTERGGELFRLTPIRTLRMGDEDGLDDLARCKHLLRITMLDLTGTGLGDKYFGTAKFFGSKYLANITTLLARGIDDNGHLDASGLKAIVRSKHLGRLRRLDIGGNWLFALRSDDELRVVAGLLLEIGRLPGLTELHLDGLWMSETTVSKLAGQTWLQRLKVLDLHRNYANDFGLRAIAESPHLDAIGRLDLRENDGHGTGGMTPTSPAVKQLLKRRFGKRVLL